MAAETTSILSSNVHFFCDHRCWRCPLTRRCDVFARVSKYPAAKTASDPVGRVAAVVLASVHVTVEQTAELMGHFPFAAQAVANTAEAETAAERRHAEVTADSLVMRGKEYAQGALRVVRALRPKARRTNDLDALDACDRLDEMCLTVASKIFRAVASRMADPRALDAPQDDANGSAKVALLLIEESRQAWSLLSAPGRSFGNGAPRQFIAVLGALEAGLLERFPQAFSFIRPGFDTGDADRETTLMAKALFQNLGDMPS